MGWDPEGNLGLTRSGRAGDDFTEEGAFEWRLDAILNRPSWPGDSGRARVLGREGGSVM